MDRSHVLLIAIAADGDLAITHSRQPDYRTVPDQIVRTAHELAVADRRIERHGIATDVHPPASRFDRQNYAAAAATGTKVQRGTKLVTVVKVSGRRLIRELLTADQLEACDRQTHAKACVKSLSREIGISTL